MGKIKLSLCLVMSVCCMAVAQQTELKYLSGHGPEDAVEWDFWCSDGMNANKWSKIEVPSCWEQQGFGGYTYGRYYIYKERDKDKKYDAYREHDFWDEYGIYRHEFNVSEEWKGKQVDIVFDGVMTDANVKINGKSAGPIHKGAFYRFSYDITSRLNYGDTNTLEVIVNKQSSDPSVNAAERRADWWLFGGIYRPVYLVAKPKEHIDHVAVDAKADGTLHADFLFKNIRKGKSIELTLTDCSTKERLGSKVCRLSADPRQTISTQWNDIKPWDPEHPNLYMLGMRLLDKDGNVIHQQAERIGFRTIDFRLGDGLYLNGTRLLIKGTNRHCFDPQTGRTLSRDMSLKDAKLIKQMNMNAVRSHYPPDSHFLDICDSIGLLYLDELCGWQNSYSTEMATRLLPEMIRRDVNHPCIFLWANGNEGGWNTDVDSLFSHYDPQKRHVVHPWSDFDNLDTRHYPNHNDNAYRLERGHKVFMMTEFLHGLYDRGQGAGMKGLWQRFRENPLFAGGFLWAYVDEAIHRSDNGQMDTYGPNAPDGIVSADRQQEGSFFTVREIWSPVQLRPLKITPSFNGEFIVGNDFLFSNLDECRMTWCTKSAPCAGNVNAEVIDSGEVNLPSLCPGEWGKAHFILPKNFFNADLLQLTALNAHGDTICDWSMPIKDNKCYFAGYKTSATGGKAIFNVEGDQVILKANGLAVTFDNLTGKLLNIKNGDNIIPFDNGPMPEGMKAIFRSSDIRMDADTAVYVVKYSGAVDSIVWRMTPDGLLGMEAKALNYRKDNDFDGPMFDRPVYNLGFSFSFPEKNVTGMKWLGKGPYRVWKNRMEGCNFGLWHKDYNNTVTGEYHVPVVYPEFKGYHANLYWAQIQSDTTPFTVFSETEGIFLRIFSPDRERDREGRGESVKQYPVGDISFLWEIPPVNSQGLGGDGSYIKINKGDEGFSMKLWFKFK